MSVIRILCVASDLYPAVVGGIGVVAHEMSKEQVKLGHDVTVYTSGADGRPMREFKDGYKIIRFKSIMKLMGNTFMPGMLFKLMRAKNDFDIIHAHSHLYLSTNLCALVKRLGSPPLVITVHGLFSQTAPLPIQKIYLPTIAKWTLRSADRVICLSTENKRELEELGIASANIRIIHNGIDVTVFTPPERKQGKTSNQILWVGRFVPGKGVECLISAFHILVRKNENYRLTMVGEGPLKEKIKHKIRGLGLSQYIHFRDFIPNTELPDLYRNSDVFVLTSINEGVPLTILEAMACGVPVVSTKLPQLVNIVNGCGLLVPVGNPESVADAVSTIATDRELAQKLGQIGRAKVVRDYSWEDTVEKTIELYQELI